MNDAAFIQIVWDFYKKNKRPMPWREDTSPYIVFISEVMLQQTQVTRVLIKFPLFISQFPGFFELAKADTATLLLTWQGMGYNRRALYLRTAAQVVCEKYNGTLPHNTILLDELPGIGPATASSIAAFAFNQPVSFIETNIRRVYIHHFFTGKNDVTDTDIFPIVQRTVDKKKAREWYWALMDYGSYLAKQIDNPNKKSKHYNKQKKFEGSTRQLRGEILKNLLSRPLSSSELNLSLNNDERLFTSLQQLEIEGFLVLKKGKYYIK